MTDITPATLADTTSAAPRKGAGPGVSRAEIHAFGGIAALVAVILGATLTFGLAGLIAVYVALVPVCLIVLVLITVGR